MLDKVLETELKNKYKNKYDYKDACIEKNGNRNQIKNILCNTCNNTFDVKRLSKHKGKDSQGCPHCSKIETSLRKSGPKAPKDYKGNPKYYNIERVIDKKPEYIFCYDTVRTMDRIPIYCKEHGLFYTLVDYILTKDTGCPECAKKNSGYNKTCFKNRCNGNGTLYLIRCFNDNENFYKIGITNRTVSERYSSDMPYSVEIILEKEGEPGDIWELEWSVKRSITKYIPKLYFGGSSTECFLESNLETVKRIINENIKVESKYSKNKYFRLSKEERDKQIMSAWIERVKNRHTTKYDYSLCTWPGKNGYVTIICPKHGEFRQKVKLHAEGYGCQECGKEKAIRTLNRN